MNGFLRLALVAAIPAIAQAGCSGVREQPAGAGRAPALLLAQSAAPDAPVDLVSSGPFAYDYYPDVEAYYALDRGLWFWRGASYWGVGRRLPSTYESRMEAREIRLETDRPYRLHGLVRSIYPPPMNEGFVAAAGDPHVE